MLLEDVKGIGKKRLYNLHAAGINSLRDILYYFPVKYKNTSIISNIASIVEGETVCLSCKLIGNVSTNYYGKPKKTIAKFADESGSINCIWFNQPWIKEKLNNGTILLYGKVFKYKNNIYLNNPSIETEKRIIPEYKKIDGVPSSTIKKLIQCALDHELNNILDFIPSNLCTKFNLCSKIVAIKNIHYPLNLTLLAQSQQRIYFEDLLTYFTLTESIKIKNKKSISVIIKQSEINKYWSALDFKPTNAQYRVLNEVALDLKSEEPMSRLIQGDVGSGKTAVAFGAAYLVVNNGYQCVLMAPTETLAYQHFNTASKLFKKFNISCGLLTGSLKVADRKQLLNRIKENKIGFIIATHAAFSDDIEYAKLGLIITDEQHRFGVRQRRLLQNKASDLKNFEANMLVMSATPIPRTLALILYNDLEISIIDELPKGRLEIKTAIVNESKKTSMYNFILKEVNKGNQAYIICPVIEDTDENPEMQSVTKVYNKLKSTYFKSINIDFIHGKLKPSEKNEKINRFKNGFVNVLISTTVLEVGIDVKNATIMVIENANHFGLAQLHQLRGRVGRGNKQSWCFLMSKPNERLKVLCSTNDGFEIAQRDLEIRGTGDILGFKQHGMSKFSIDLLDLDQMQLILNVKKCIETINNDAKYNKEKDLLEKAIDQKLLELKDKISLS